MNQIQTVTIDGPDPYLYQWDRGQRIRLRGIQAGAKAELARYGQEQITSLEAYRDGDGIFCDIPDALLTEQGHLRGVVYTENGEACPFLLTVISRAGPEARVPLTQGK